MRSIGILLTFQAPPAFGVATEVAYAQALEQAVAAEDLGFDSVWVTEHHFQDDGYLSAPLIGLTAIAARTSRVRVGTAVLLLPMTNPVRLAEDAATLDVLSNGRLDLGVGMGYRDEEFHGLGVSRPHRRPLFEEGLDILERAWSGERFDFDGECWTIRGALVRPRPVQRPHPPLWFGAKSEAGMRRAAERGAPFLLPMTPTLEQVTEQAATYRTLLGNEGAISGEISMALLRETWVSASDADAWPEIEPAFRFAYSETYGPDQIPYYDGDRRITSADDPFMWSEAFRRDRMLYGSAATVADGIERFPAGTGADQLICRFQLPGLDHEAVLGSMKRFADDVMPRL